jgi:hypothetical protein
MDVMGFLFVVGPVALPAILRHLIAMPKRRGPGVTDQTVNIRVR